MTSSNNIYLQLGDIIQIDAPNNPELNKHVFLIDYINDTKISIKQEGSTTPIILNINDDGSLSDESIERIDILVRPENKGYARQNNLLPDTWVDLHFGGDLPVTITGKITNLEEDMIEVELINDGNDINESDDKKEIIYIDFAWKGIPEDIPIEKIIIRPAPEISKKKIEDDLEAPKEDIMTLNVVDENDETNFDEVPEFLETTFEIPVENIKNQIKDMLLEADQIEFGSSLAPITTIREVSEEQKRFGIETQTNELLDDLLASIPNANRTRSVLNNIHIMIERFKQLRTSFSTFDDNGNANKPIFKGALYKPLIDRINNLNYKLFWILPVAQNVKKLYDLDISLDTIHDYPDIISLTLGESLINESNIRDLYRTNTDNYSTYMNKLQPSLTPFDTNYDNESLTIQHVQENFDTVIDNLDRFYSSVAKNDELKRKRFLITRYNLGLSKLQTTELTSIKMKTKTVPMTNNDLISVNSMLTFREPIVRFSNINLPGTTIYDKSNLNIHFLKYWKVFHENTSVTTKFINNLDNPVSFDETNYLKHKTQYILNENNNDPDKFKKFLNIIIPKTRVLFNLIKKYITGKLSLVTVVNYLQPFLIYLDDISFKQYEEITTYIEQEILLYKQKYITSKDSFDKLNSKETYLQINYTSILYKILQGRADIGGLVLEGYGLNTIGKRYMGTIPNDIILTPSEMIKYMNEVDYTKSFNTSQTILNNDLFTPFDFDNLLEEKKDEYKKELEKTRKENDCSQYTLTKRYIALEDLTADNDIPVYFDKKYDPTVYDILEEYKFEQSEMDEPTFKNFLIDSLIKNIGLSRPNAKYEATSMLSKKREVQEGHYAVLEMDNIDNVVYYYYKRENDQWIRDESIPQNSFFGSNELFCNIQNKCIEINKKCVDPEFGAEIVKKDLIKEMYDEFDSTYIENVENYKKKINKLWKYEYELLVKLRIINKYLLYKYENDKLKLVKPIEESDVILSPYSKLFDIIMGQSDFVKKQHDIIQFVNKYTRPMNPLIDTNKNCKVDTCDTSCKYWLYCTVTNNKLVPTFISTLASVFVENGNYFQTITEIKNYQGIEIDDKIVDEHSGLEIEKIALSSDEGFEDSGFKMQSREILEKNAGDAIFQTPNEQKLIKKELLMNPKGKIINNVITSTTNYMGIVLEHYRELIIQHTLTALDETVDSQDVYERKIEHQLKEGIKIPSYQDVFSKSLLAFTFAYISIYISVSIPSIQSKKTFPGCKRSFVGYPITGDEDSSNIKYIACVAAGIKTKIYPWKAIPKSADKIATIIKKTMNAYVLKQGEIKMLINEKRNYLLQNEDDLIPIELDIKNWINFLPPLQNITNKTPSILDKPFKESLLQNIKSGSKDQFEQIRVVNSKMIYFSMAIIQDIHKVVKKEDMLLTNSNKVPFIQNACCNTGEYKTIDYFIKKEPSILKNNDIVSYLSNINYDMINMAQSTLLVDPQNSKIKFPPINSEFSQSTIYQGFIEFCHFNTDSPINSQLTEYCLTKPEDFDKNKTLKENIDIFKQEGISYSLDSFNKLLDAVNKLNIIPLDLVHTIPSSLSQIRDLVDHMIDSQNSMGTEFLTLYKNVLDSYDIDNSSNNTDVRDLRNYLGDNIPNLENEVIGYFNQFSNLTRGEKEKLYQFIKTIMDFHSNGNEYFTNSADETLYRAISFIKNVIFNFVKVFPNIIINKVNFEEIKIPPHWDLTESHNFDIKNIIKEYYREFSVFYSDPTIIPYLQQNKSELLDFMKLVEYTNLYANIVKLDGEEISSILDNKTTYQLFQYFFLFMVKHLFELTGDKSLLKTEVIPPMEEDIIATSLELEGDDMGEVLELDIVRGEQRSVREKIANFVVSMLNISKKEKNIINLNTEMIRDKINRKKDQERHKLTSNLRDMNREQREIENLFKNHRLERWNKGLQKGLTQYVGKTYDEERQDREKEQIIERQWEEGGLLDQAISADRDIMMLEHQDVENTVQRINDEVNDMSHIFDDDDRDDDNDDEYRIEFEESDE